MNSKHLGAEIVTHPSVGVTGLSVATPDAPPDEKASRLQWPQQAVATQPRIATAGLKPIHALVLLPTHASHTPYHTALDRTILLWQIEWLEACGISVTLVTDDPAIASFFGAHLTEQSEPTPGRVTICGRTRVMTLIEQLAASRAVPVPLVAVMGGPFFTNCNLARTMERHRRDHVVTTVISDERTRRAQLVVVPAPLCAAVWYEFLAKQVVDSPDTITTAPGPVRYQRARFWAYREGHSENEAALARAWAACPPAAAYRVRNGVYIHPTARVAPSARLRGPVLIGKHATIEEHALIGPWTSAGTGSYVGPRAWAERCALGDSVQLDAEACVYAAEIDAGEQVAGDRPLLHTCCKQDGDVHQVSTEHLLTHMPRPGYLRIKRLLDVVIAGVALLALSPLLMLTGALCLLDTGWPVLFVHERLGHKGKPVTVYKFRTMRRSSAEAPQVEQALANSPGYKLEEDPRVTRLGRLLRRTSLDELPQLFNVVRGDISLVGPRPIVQQEAERYGPYVANLLSVQPGLTGLWQVSGRSNTTYAQRVWLDVKYATERTTAWDAQIILRTLPTVVFQRGAQ